MSEANAVSFLDIRQIGTRSSVGDRFDSKRDADVGSQIGYRMKGGSARSQGEAFTVTELGKAGNMEEGYEKITGLSTR